MNIFKVPPFSEISGGWDLKTWYKEEKVSKEQTKSTNTKKYYIHDCKVRLVFFK